MLGLEVYPGKYLPPAVGCQRSNQDGAHALLYSLRLINAAGQVLLETTVSQTVSDALLVKSFPTGVYFAELRLGSQRIVRRWIKL